MDDDDSLRRALRRQLQVLGFIVRDFHSAEELLSGDLPTGNACLLSDVYMPRMNGIELCRSLAASKWHLPTILMSGSDDERTRKRMREANPIASLANPSIKKACCARFGWHFGTMKKTERSPEFMKEI